MPNKVECKYTVVYEWLATTDDGELYEEIAVDHIEACPPLTHDHAARLGEAKYGPCSKVLALFAGHHDNLL